MLKKMIFILSLTLSIATFAAQKECPVKPSYDIVINKDSIHIYNKSNDLSIMNDGQVILNKKIISPNPSLRKKLDQFEKALRSQLPQLEQQSLSLLSEVKVAFDQAITKKLSDDRELHSELNKLYKRLVKLLHGSLISEDGSTKFYYQKFNKLKKDGHDIGERIFYNVIGGSILEFNLFKNIAAIKDISKNEWKAQKPKLKAFDAHICSVITDVDQQYQQILTELNQSADK